ncbi:MAG: hypothetical protein JNL58_27375 [Planctomyces sp.]|nr:hypothetical protein [Planctomyces sp.]
MTIRAAVMQLALSVLMFVPAAGIAQEDLQWKFQSGETLKYTVQQKMQTSLTSGGRTFNSSLQQTMNMSWKIGAVAPSGDGTVTQSVDRVQLTSEGPGGTVTFDSAAEKNTSSPQLNALSETYGKIIGQEFAMTMKPTGKVENVKIPDSLLQSIRKSAGSATNPLTEESLRSMMEQASVTLPGGPIAAGQSWDSTQTVDLPFGQMKIVSNMTYEGIDTTTKMAKIKMKPSISITPKENAAIQMTLKSAEGVGQVQFDQVKGRISRSELDLTLTMTVSRDGTSVDQTTVQKTVMQLNP